ncbi:hypothetical protein LUZ60_012805 [Juncus effusus]|nr:hypothetical protein LUZ60_012805 [Juncus effusus]
MSHIVNDDLYKLVVVGKSCVGKSSLFSRFIRDEFGLRSQSIDAESATREIHVDDKFAKAEIWDITIMKRFISSNFATKFSLFYCCY